METRRRGRDARARTDDDEAPGNSAANTSTGPASPSQPPPSTRFRTRQRAVAALNHISSRPTPVSTSNPSARSSPPTSTRPLRSLPVVTAPVARSRRAPTRNPTGTLPSSSRTVQPAASQRQSASGVQVSPTEPVASRKRTRSSTRRNSVPSSNQAHPPSTAGSRVTPLPIVPSLGSGAPALFESAPTVRPLKRSRKALVNSRLSKGISRFSSGSRPLPGASSSHLTNQAMDLSSSHGGGSERDSDQNGERSNADGPSPTLHGSDRAGSNTLQGLLRRLGADLRDILPGNVGSSHTRLQQLRAAISNPEGDEQQIDALSELCEFLSVGTEETLVSFSVTLFVTPLVVLLRTGHNIEIKIYAARALTHMMEALPSSASSIANQGAAGPLCENLLSIEYIDLAEQSLSALQKLSVDYPQQIVLANGFQAVLSFIDFFSIGMQRVAAATACNLCRLSQTGAMHMISGVLPTMMRLLDSDDQRIREFALLGFMRLAESFRSSPSELESLCGEGDGLIGKVLGLILPSSPLALAPQSYSSALRLLAALARGSSTLGLRIISSETLLLNLKERLSSSATPHSVDCLVLIDSLIPDIPEVEGSQSPAVRSRRRRVVGSSLTHPGVDTRRREDLEKDAKPLEFFGRTLLGTLMNFYVSSAEVNARRIALSVMSKFIDIASHEVLLEVITEDCKGIESLLGSNSTCFCPFVAALLGENSSRNEALVGLAMADSALQKLPKLRESFIREGVVHEITRLAAIDGAGGVEPPDASLQNSAADQTSTPNVSGMPVGSLFGIELSGHGFARPSSWNRRGLGISGATDPLWTAVSSIQRSTARRNHPADPSAAPLHVTKSFDFRVTDMQSLSSLVQTTARSILRSRICLDSDDLKEVSAFKNVTLEQLSEVSCLLQSTSLPNNEANGKEAMKKLADLLTAAESLTIFEVSKSALMEALASYLTPSDQDLKSSRILSMVECLYTDTGHAFSSLVALALGVLSSVENLAVRGGESASGPGTISLTSGLRQLASPFRLRLRKAPNEKGTGLRDYSQHVVLIEPLATMASVEEFLWPRVHGPERDGSAAGPSASLRRSTENRGSRSRHESDSPRQESGVLTPSADQNDNPAGEAVELPFGGESVFNLGEPSDDEDVVGDENNEVHNSDPSDEDVSSGEEDVIEHDNAEIDGHRQEGGDAFDVDQRGSSLLTIDLDDDSLFLPTEAGPASGQSHIGSIRVQISTLISRMSSPTRLRPHLNRLMRDMKNTVPKLSFKLDGKVLPSDSSILNALIQSSTEDNSTGSGMWSAVHTLFYSKADVMSCEASSAALRAAHWRNTSAGKPGPNSGGEAGRVRRSQRLLENRERSKISTDGGNFVSDFQPSRGLLSTVMIEETSLSFRRLWPSTDLPSSVSPIIEVLKHLYRMNEVKGGGVQDRNVLSKISSLEGNVDFHSSKLTAKLLGQLSDTLALCGGVIPPWCFSLSRDASFLIPFETRRLLFQSTSLGVVRALHLLQTRVDVAAVTVPSHRGSRGGRDGDSRVGRIQRQRVIVRRQSILHAAVKAMSLSSAHSSVLEVQYHNEAGTGLGPTLEFFTLASRQIQRVDLALWRNSSEKVPKGKGLLPLQNVIPSVQRSRVSKSGHGHSALKRRKRKSKGNGNVQTFEAEPEGNDEVAFVTSTGSGLYPCCVPITCNVAQQQELSGTRELFRFVGRLIGKALMDGRLLDLRFSKTFSRLLLAYCRVLYEKGKETFNDTCATWARRSVLSLAGMDAMDRQKVWEVFTAGSSAVKLLEDVDPQLASSLKSILEMVRGGQGDSIGSLCLSFVLPGDDEIELIENGSNVEVSGANVEDYIRRVMFHVLFGGVHKQVEALLHGLSDMLDVTSLLIFESHELELLICGPAYEEWSVEFLSQATRCDHGYSHESQSVQFFMRILCSLSEADQQRFVLFATGSPALPLGGLRNLHPKLTIVRRTPEAGHSADECLPTVMTCTNYFKLPDYSSFEIAKRQILYALREGQGSFHLS